LNNPLNVIDPDGRDIIVLSHGPRDKTSIDGGKTNGHGHYVGHMAVLIGNDKTGWKYMSYDYDKGENKGSGANSVNNNYTSTSFKTLNDFKNSEHNTFKDDYDDGKGLSTSHREKNGEIIQRYQDAFQLTTDSNTDSKMIQAADATFTEPWGQAMPENIISGQANQCTTVAENALNAGGLANGEMTIKRVSKCPNPKSAMYNKPRYTGSLNFLPAAKQKGIETNNRILGNEGKDVDSKIKRTR
jgi:hypothetical protein